MTGGGVAIKLKNILFGIAGQTAIPMQPSRGLSHTDLFYTPPRNDYELL